MEFLGKAKEKDKEKDKENKDKENIPEPVDEYKKITEFVLELTSLLKNPQTEPYVISYCLIMKQSEISKNIIKNIFGTENPTVLMVQKRFNQTQLKLFFECCFEWASSCGDLYISSQASFITLNHITHSEPFMIDIIIRTLSILITTIKEKNTTTITKHNFSVFADDYSIDMKLLYGYIAKLINLLSDLNLLLDEPQEKVFWVASEFLLASDHDFNGIFGVTVKAIESYLNKSTKVTKVPENYDGLLQKLGSEDLLLDSRDLPQGLMSFCRAVLKLAMIGKYEVIVGSFRNGCEVANAEAITILFLIPYFATHCDENMFDEYAENISNKSIDISPIWKEFREHSMRMSETSLIKDLAELATTDLMLLVLRMYALLIKNAPFCTASVCSVCVALLSLDKCPVPYENFGRIINFAIKDKEEENSSIECELLQAYQKKAVFVKLATHPPPSKFPVEEIPEMFEPEKWKITSEMNSMDSILYLPPFYPIDQTLVILPFPDRIMKNCCMKYQITPFTQWNKILFEAESIRIDPEEIHETKYVFKFDKNDIEAFMDKTVKRNGEIKSKEVVDEINQKNVSDEFDCLKLPKNLFMPTLDYIENLGGEIPGEEEYLNIFSN
ncbi:hypothetical protein GPJ56_003725 [Histomonas meleagridis]|uniref:uncharacterized protein n=1 Tax=Histomonas meleagridis TaxID=135588 RepID=UPI00355A1F0E|nr:hypothetical protein GPJ56_003725 [Histomonas meleagridis]KAH0800557.1 hypothetical protein GO595_006625 [Histomonas meleagridis]